MPHLQEQHVEWSVILSLCVGSMLPGEAPQDEAQATVRVQADGYLARGVELTLQLNGAAQSTDCSMRHLTGNRHKHCHQTVTEKELNDFVDK